MALRLKRKSEGNRPGSGKELKELTDGTTGESVPLLPDAAKFVESMQAWLQEKMDMHANVNAYFADRFKDEATLQEFLEFLDSSFPEVPQMSYCKVSDMTTANQGVLLRPWMLSFLPSSGFKGYVEPDVLQNMVCLIAARGFLTDSNLGGVEKLTVCLPAGNMCQGRTTLKPGDVVTTALDTADVSQYVPPMGLFLVKGWTRSLACMCVLACAWENPAFFEAMPVDLKRSFSVIHAATQVLQPSEGMAALCAQNRGITYSSTSTRRRPNCFNLLHQLLMMKTDAERQVMNDVWDDLSSFQQAFSIGNKEAGAAWNLLKHIDGPVVEALMLLVQQHSQQKLISHEPLAQGLFNSDYNGALGSLSPWDAQMLNSTESVLLLVRRMKADFEGVSAKMRKPFGAKEIEVLQRLTTVFLSAMDALQQKLPEDFFASEQPGLMKSFMARHLDADLENLFSSTVPPIQLDMISNVRSSLFKYKRKVDECAEAAAEKLQTELQSVSMKQTVQKIERECQEMSSWAERRLEWGNRQGSLDIKYLKERYEKGTKKIQQFCSDKHRVTILEDGVFDECQAEIVRFCTSTGASGNATTLMILDLSSWPARSQWVDDALEVAKTICNGNNCAALLVLTPVVHTASAQMAIMTKRRQLEDKLFTRFDAAETSLYFNDASHGNDKRRTSQPCWLCISKVHSSNSPWTKSKAMLGNIGPVDRPRVSDLVPVDPDKPLSAGQRAMQKGVQGCTQILQYCLEGMGGSNGRLEQVVVVEFCVSRFNEWGLALWGKQKKLLDGTVAEPIWFYEGFVVEHPEHDKRDHIGGKISTHLQGKMMAEWWDHCIEAGPKTRNVENFGEPKPVLELLAWDSIKNELKIPPAVEEKFGGALVPHAGNELATIKAEVNAWNQKWGNFLRDDSRPATDTAGSVAAPSPQRSRVVCQPEFGPEDGLIDVSSTHVFLDGDMLPSDHAFELLACGPSGFNTSVKFFVTKSFDIYLVNESESAISLAPTELFGFGLGSFTEKMTSMCGERPSDCLPWMLKKDSELVIFTEAGQGKQVFSLASLICHMASKHGIMEVTVTDHNITPLCEANGEAKRFRYSMSPKTKVCVLGPKQLEANTDMMNMRHTMIGAVFHGSYQLLPKNNVARVCWEVACERSVPAEILPRKAKLWLLKNVTLRAKTAHHLKQ